MTIKPQQFTSVPVRIEAIRVTVENMAEVAKWCDGEIRQDHETKRMFIKVEVFRPVSKRQTQAFVGDWVTISRTGNKVYLAHSFAKAFIEIVPDDAISQVGAENASKAYAKGTTGGVPIFDEAHRLPVHICPECEKAAPGELCVNLFPKADGIIAAVI